MIKKISRQAIHIIKITLIYEICRDIFILLFFEFFVPLIFIPLVFHIINLLRN